MSKSCGIEILITSTIIYSLNCSSMEGLVNAAAHSEHGILI
jgi:hypothetical protein